MRATEEAAFVPDRLKAYALSMACEMLLKYCIVINGGSWKAKRTGAKRCACTLTYH